MSSPLAHRDDKRVLVQNILLQNMFCIGQFVEFHESLS